MDLSYRKAIYLDGDTHRAVSKHHLSLIDTLKTHEYHGARWSSGLRGHSSSQSRDITCDLAHDLAYVDSVRVLINRSSLLSALCTHCGLLSDWPSPAVWSALHCIGRECKKTPLWTCKFYSLTIICFIRQFMERDEAPAACYAPAFQLDWYLVCFLLFSCWYSLFKSKNINKNKNI